MYDRAECSVKNGYTPPRAANPLLRCSVKIRFLHNIIIHYIRVGTL